jgi:hypothetical protein
MMVFHVFGVEFFRDLIRLRLVHGVRCVAAEIWRSDILTFPIYSSDFQTRP